MDSDIKKLKKIELHVHLDGSVSPKLASTLSKIDERVVRSKMEVSKNNSNLSDYLKKFEFSINLLKSKKNLQEVAYNLALRLRSDNIIYAEVRFAPLLLKGNLSYDTIVETVLDGVRKVKGIKINLLLCLMRGASYEENLKTILTAKKYLNQGVGGIDLAGDEKKYPLSDYKKLFELARILKIPFTIHAGEDSPRDIELAIKLGAKRIGHGVKIIGNPELIKKVKDNNILLEVCPTSNIQTKAFLEYKEHPIYKLYKEGVNLLVNTDNMTVSRITLSEEYKKLLKTFPFTIEDFKKINRNALNYAFLSSKEKLELLEELKK